MIRTHGVTHYDPESCFGCKVLSVQIQPDGGAFKPHYNWSVGKFVNSKRDYENELNRCADRNSEATGVDHSYEPRYPGDTEPIRSADGVLDKQAANHRAISEGKGLVHTA